MKTMLYVLIVALLCLAGWTLWQQRLRLADARAEVGAMQLQLDDMLHRVRLDSLRSDSLQRVADSLDALAEGERERARDRERVLASQADSLATTIGELVPPGEVREAVTQAVQELRATYEERLANLEGVLVLSDERNRALQQRHLERDAIEAGLREALELKTRQCDVWEAVANPSLWDRAKAAALPLAGGVLLVLILL